MSSIGKLMKQAARMQQQMEQVQAQLAARTVEATSGGGAVKVTAKCDGTIASIKIDPQALNPSDAQLLEDMIVTAANQALGQAKEISNAEMGKVTAGLNLPGLSVRFVLIVLVLVTSMFRLSRHEDRWTKATMHPFPIPSPR